MPTPETIEFLSFRRTFTLLIALVVVPSAGLSGFGVVAIINERAAVEKRLEAAWRGRLEAVHTALHSVLNAAQHQRTEDGLDVTVAETKLTLAPFRSEGGRVTTEDRHLRQTLEAVPQLLASVPAERTSFSVAGPGGTWLLTALREGGTVLGASLAPDKLGQLVAKAGDAVTPPGEKVAFELAPVKKDLPQGVAGRLAEAREALGPQPLAALVLAAPWQDLQLVVRADGEDPVAKASLRNRVLYGVLLGIFYVTLALGIAYTGRTLYREAKLSRLKTDFVSLVSHELRTPLTSIRMFIEMLATNRVRDEAEMRTVLELLSKETARLSSLIEGVLDWARIESGRKQYEQRVVPAQQIVDQALEALRAQRVGSPVEVAVTVEPTLRVQADAQALAGALLNLLQNAYKYTAADGRTIALRAQAVDGEAVFEVQDNGSGIPRREHKKIFERFYRVDSLLTRQTEGTGLGLSIAQRIVQAHGGHMSVDSAPGKGSTFRMHLPLPTTP